MPAITLDEKAIIDFVVKSGRSYSENYELITAVLLKRFCEKKWASKCVIGFILKNSYSGKLSSKGFVGVKELQEILLDGAEKDHPVDVCIYEKATLFSKRKGGRLFQLKRFGFGKNFKNKNTNGLLQYLQKDILMHYAKTNATLFLLIDNIGDAINFKQVIKGLSYLNPKQYPFEAIMFATLSDHKIYICQLWPTEGQCEFDFEELMRI